jgi:S-adenosylmethionine hydrolase
VESLGDLATLVTDCAGRRIFGIGSTYGSARPGELVAIFDSQDRLEIAFVSGSAASELRATTGVAVTISTEA